MERKYLIEVHELQIFIFYYTGYDGSCIYGEQIEDLPTSYYLRLAETHGLEHFVLYTISVNASLVVLLAFHVT